MSQPTDIESPGAGFDRAQRTGLVTLLFTDMVGSTALKHELGDRAAAELFRKHHEVIRETLKHFPQGEEIETAGDSFFLTFATPSDAAEFALLAQARLRRLREGSVSLDRMGIHVGEVVVGRDTQSRKPRELFGIQIDICSRVMSLAKAGQTLMTRAVFDSARQVLKGEDIREVGALEWLNYGPYLLKGLEEPVEICEVREAGRPASGPPPNSEKAQRKVSADEEPVLGWRPAVSQPIANTRWVLEKKLGEGGFGEVWLGRHQHTKERRVFKFCFQAERVRFLKREMTLFRVLKDRVGDHPNIVRLHDIMLDHPPFYLEMDYVEGADLRGWCEEHGGAAALRLETRLEIVAQAAEGLQAAHEAGIIHRDIKPANILVAMQYPHAASGHPLPLDGRGAWGEGSVRVKLTDFGIGQVVSEESLKGITRAGFTQTIMSDSFSSQTGTQLYIAPELVAGRPASTRSDIYSLGVVLYQLLLADFTQPVTGDWSAEIQDPLIREDLQRCLAGKPQDRFAGADQLARHLRALPERRAQMARREVEKAALERAAYRRGMMRTAGVAGVILLVIAGLAMVAVSQSRRARLETARAAQAAQTEKLERLRAEAGEYAANMNLAQHAWEQNNVGRARQLLEQTATYPGRGFEWYYWQRQAHLEIKTLRGHTAAVMAVAFSPDGQRIVTGSADQTAKVWEAATGKELLTLKGHSGPVTSVAISPDGQRIVTSSSDTMTKIWAASTGKELITLKGHGANVLSTAFSLDGQRIVTGGLDQAAKLWDATNGKEIFTLKGHSAEVDSVAFSPDGHRIATGSGDAMTKIWEASSGRELFTLKGHSGPVTSVAFSPDRQRIVTGSNDRMAKVWEAATGRELLTLKGHGARIGSVALSPDGQRIVTGSGDQTAKVWDAADGKELLTLEGHSGPVTSVAFSPDGQRIVTGSDDQTVKVWDAATGTEPLARKGQSVVWSVAFSPDGQRVAIGSGAATAKVWEAASGKELLTLQGHGGATRFVAFSPDGRRILTGSADQTAKVWEAATGKEMLTLKGHKGEVTALAFSSDGRRIATGSLDKTAKLWDATNGKELVTLKGHSARILSVSFSPDGHRVATSSEDQTARIWEAASGKELVTLKGHAAPWIWSVAFSPDGQRIATGSMDQTAKIWEAATGKELLTLKGHSGEICSVAFSPDGQRIVTGSDDETAKVWGAADGKELLTLKGHSARIWSVAFCPDGQRIATGSHDGMVKIWEAASGRAVIEWQRDETAAMERLAILKREQAAEVEHDRARRAQDPGIKQWLLLAPIAFEGGGGMIGTGVAELDQEQIAGEAKLHPRAGERVKVGSRELVWSTLQLEDHLIDFNQFVGQETDWSVAYAVSYVRSEAAQTGLLMKVGSDDEAKIYLNGEEIYRFAARRSYVPDQNVVAGVRLNAGLNVLVFKVVNEANDWQGSVRFTDAAGQPIKGIKVTLDPEVKD